MRFNEAKKLDRNKFREKITTQNKRSLSFFVVDNICKCKSLFAQTYFDVRNGFDCEKNAINK